MKELTSNRKFYNKWLYKITVEAKNGWYLRSKDLDFIKRSGAEKVFIDLAVFLYSLEKDSYATRVEGKFIDIYTNDESIIQTIQKSFADRIKHVFRPSSVKITESSDERSIVAKKLPHDRYKYKVFLLPHKIKDNGTKIKYLQWLESQCPRILITDTVKEWFKKTAWNWDRRYMYVEDEKTLLLLKMKNGEVIGSVYSYTVPINN